MFEFLRQVKTELGKVVWPTRAETLRYTFTVIIFSLVVAAILGLFDYLILAVITKILTR